jgi:hypothetical protein
VRKQHRIQARLVGTMSEPPTALSASLTIARDSAGSVTILTSGDLAPLLGWLAEQPLESLQIEPVGLRTVYERHHPAGVP